MTAGLRRRRLVEEWRADVDVIEVEWQPAMGLFGDPVTRFYPSDARMEQMWLASYDPDGDDLVRQVSRVPACRCWRCGRLLTADDVQLDRLAGRFRPACDDHVDDVERRTVRS